MPLVENSEDTIGRQRRIIAVGLNVVFTFLIFVPLIVLGSALEWPTNLSKDASHNLPLLLEERMSTFWGYFFYLIYSILFFPMGYMMARVVAGETLKNSPLISMASGFAAISALARSIGLCRWLFAMPILARIYVDEETTDTTREAVSVAYEMLNGWGGGIGEILGVSIFAALWIVCTSILYIQSPEWPSWMGWIGFLVAIDLAVNMLEMAIVEIDMGINLTLSVVFLQFWVLAAAVLFLRLGCLKCLETSGAAENGKEDNDAEEPGATTKEPSNVVFRDDAESDNSFQA